MGYSIKSTKILWNTTQLMGIHKEGIKHIASAWFMPHTVLNKHELLPQNVYYIHI